MANARSRHKCEGLVAGVNNGFVGDAHLSGNDGSCCVSEIREPSERRQRSAQQSSSLPRTDETSAVPLPAGSTYPGRQTQVKPGFCGSHVRRPSKTGDEAAFKPSKLDFFDPQSDLARSEYRGIAILLFICTAFYMVANPIMRWYERNEFVDPSLARMMFYDFFFLMFMWFKLSVWSLTALGAHVLFMKGWIGRRALHILQHSTQVATIGYAVGHCLYNKWPIIPAAFVQIAAVVNFMKMHSFTETNLGFYDRQGTPDACEHYPENVSFSNFCYYLAAPSLVYEPKFVRGNGFRPSYFLWKLISMVAAMTAMYLACTSYLIPTIIRSPTVSVLEAICNLIFPFLFLDLLIFFILFECICNLLAEVTNFADRDFYRDWWNSTNWDEYSRKWNRPVHKFLLRHVYMETQHKYRWSPRGATVATFLFSALLHEMIMAVCFRFVRFYLFGLMLLQLPLIALGRMYKNNRCLANGIFWACMLLGPPLLAVAYGREFAQIHYYVDGGDGQELRLFH